MCSSDLLATAGGLLAAGLTILAVGVTRVFVPQDLTFMRTTPEALGAISPRLIPLIAHDRAGFGGALASFGVAMFASVRYGRPSKALWQALGIAGLAGFGTAVGVHPAIGYLSVTHLAPAVLGFVVFTTGLAFASLGSRAAG